MEWQGKLTATGEAVQIEAVNGVITAITPLELNTSSAVADNQHSQLPLPWVSAGWTDL